MKAYGGVRTATRRHSLWAKSTSTFQEKALIFRAFLENMVEHKSVCRWRYRMLLSANCRRRIHTANFVVECLENIMATQKSYLCY
jgi:hypothetical protein